MSSKYAAMNRKNILLAISLLFLGQAWGGESVPIVKSYEVLLARDEATSSTIRAILSDIEYQFSLYRQAGIGPDGKKSAMALQKVNEDGVSLLLFVDNPSALRVWLCSTHESSQLFSDLKEAVSSAIHREFRRGQILGIQENE
jgi:hypothetical protein